MNTSFEDQVREHAYHLWIAGGMADGQAHEHWALAEQAVKASEPVVILTKAKKPAAKVAKPAAKAVTKTVAKAAKPVAKTTAKKAAKAEMAAAH